MEYDDLQRRYLESLDAIQALLNLLAKRENEINALYSRLEDLEVGLEKRDRIISILKVGRSEALPNNKKNIAPNGTGSERPLAVLVDPVPRMRIILKEIITSAGFIVVGEAVNTETAVRLTKQGKPDLVILSSKLGSESGLEALKKMREVIPELKAILITEGSDSKTVILAMEQGVANIIPKPINRLRLHELAVALAKGNSA